MFVIYYLDNPFLSIFIFNKHFILFCIIMQRHLVLWIVVTFNWKSSVENLSLGDLKGTQFRESPS